MSKFIITEEEKNRILNLHKSKSSKQYLMEDSKSKLPQNDNERILVYDKLGFVAIDLEKKLKGYTGNKVTVNRNNGSNLVKVTNENLFNVLINLSRNEIIYTIKFDKKNKRSDKNILTTINNVTKGYGNLFDFTGMNAYDNEKFKKPYYDKETESKDDREYSLYYELNPPNSYENPGFSEGCNLENYLKIPYIQKDKNGQVTNIRPDFCSFWNFMTNHWSTAIGNYFNKIYEEVNK